MLKETTKVPYGRTRTYQVIAEAAGRPEAYRQVLAILQENPIPLIVPCHRVVTHRSGIGSWIGGTRKKQWLLRLEQQAAATGLSRPINSTLEVERVAGARLGRIDSASPAETGGAGPGAPLRTGARRARPRCRRAAGPARAGADEAAVEVDRSVGRLDLDAHRGAVARDRLERSARCLAVIALRASRQLAA